MPPFNGLVKGPKSGDAERLGRLLDLLDKKPRKVLRRKSRIRRGARYEDVTTRVLAYYILTRLTEYDLNEELRDDLDDAVDHLINMEINLGYSPCTLKCPGCGEEIKMDPPVFPSLVRCSRCENEMSVLDPLPVRYSVQLSELFWNVSFVYEMARRGHIREDDRLVKRLESLKSHTLDSIRKMSRMLLIIISERS